MARPRPKDPEEPPEIPLHPLPGPLEEYRANFHTLRRLLSGILDPFDLVITDFQALRLTGDADRRPGAISLYLGISPAATTELLDRLERRGLLQRKPDPTDRRATVISITKNGEKLCREAGAAYQRFLESVLSELSLPAVQALNLGSRELRRVLERRARARVDALELEVR